jgi:cyclopropane-fatty-acyl-phospholipid synthase
MFLENRLERMVGRLKEEAAREIPLRLRLWSGRTFDLGPRPSVTVTVPRPSALRYLIAPDLMKLGEAYAEGHIDVDGALADVFDVAERLSRCAPRVSRFDRWRLRRAHSRARDRRAIEYHYDVSDDFYRLFLDRNMVYSCAYFRSEADSLEQAQEQKLDHILNKLDVRPGERLLDIGCGWGALIFRAAEKYGARCVGITLSSNQLEHVRGEIQRRGLQGRVEARLQDYRDLPDDEPFDKIASVGMIEHVGLRNLPVYFGRIARLLRDGGAVLNHGITTVDDPLTRTSGAGAQAFIDRYVFPDSELPTIGQVIQEMADARFEVVDVESLRRHYARTCEHWARGLERNRRRAIDIAGDKRYRIWSVYLQGCAHGFAQGWMNLYQVLGVKQGGPEMNRLRLTREYMYPGRR